MVKFYKYLYNDEGLLEHYIYYKRLHSLAVTSPCRVTVFLGDNSEKLVGCLKTVEFVGVKCKEACINNRNFFDNAIA